MTGFTELGNSGKQQLGGTLMEFSFSYVDIEVLSMGRCLGGADYMDTEIYIRELRVEIRIQPWRISPEARTHQPNVRL